MQSQIDKAEQEKKSLGLFKKKEKVALQEQIDALGQKLNAAKEKQTQETKKLKDSIAAQEKRISEIEKKLDNPTGK